MSDEEERLASLTLGLGCVFLIAGCAVFDRWQMPVTGLALAGMGAVLVYTALSEAGRDE